MAEGHCVLQQRSTDFAKAAITSQPREAEKAMDDALPVCGRALVSSILHRATRKRRRRRIRSHPRSWRGVAGSAPRPRHGRPRALAPDVIEDLSQLSIHCVTSVVINGAGVWVCPLGHRQRARRLRKLTRHSPRGRGPGHGRCHQAARCEGLLRHLHRCTRRARTRWSVVTHSKWVLCGRCCACEVLSNHSRLTMGSEGPRRCHCGCRHLVKRRCGRAPIHTRRSRWC
mmetsp:Transcript_385/g.1663  ORF Transcript_385/g.1663 Transcript_385/m.1663 type:complete len:228 (+) Transcript_385:97-780(+)